MSNSEDGKKKDVETFNWDAYLLEQGARAAPPECFFQAMEPPENKFEEDMKLETQDPRCPNIYCVATVIQAVGSRIRIRLDGNDSCNDFWSVVDNRQIHPIGYTESKGGMILPPMGFKGDASKWKRFLTGLLTNCTPAPAECFIPEPENRPKENLFEVGMKLEAIDKKNPYFICPSTVRQVKGREILVTFDGWSTQFDCWFAFDSRDIFPVGWTNRSGHHLHKPPAKKKPSSRHSDAASSRTPTPQTSAQVSPTVPSDSEKGEQAKESAPSKKPSPLSLEDVPILDRVKSEAGGSSDSKTGATLQKPESGSVTKTDKATPTGAGKKKRSAAAKERVAATGTTATDSDDEPLSKLPKKTQGADKKGNEKKATPTTSAPIQQDPNKNAKPAPVNANSPLPMGWGASPVARTAPIQPQPAVTTNGGLLKPALPISSAKGAHPVVPPISNLPQAPSNSVGFPTVKPKGQPNPDLVVSTKTRNDMSNSDFMGNTNGRHLPFVSTAQATWEYIRRYLKNLKTCESLLSPEIGCKHKCGGNPALKGNSQPQQMVRPIFPANQQAQPSIPGPSGGPAPTRPEFKSILASPAPGSLIDLDLNKNGKDDVVSRVQQWGVNKVVEFIANQEDPAVNSQADVFRNNEIDGKALLLMSSEMIIKFMSVKLGPALKIGSLIEDLRNGVEAVAFKSGHADQG